ncbi:MAG: hypothetical protein ABR521_09185 [Gaiellaceae bacterium]
MANAIRPERSLSAHLFAVWALFGLVALAVLVTYARLPASELYHVSGNGFWHGLGRTLVFLNYPTALVAIAVAALAASALGGRSLVVAAASIVLSAVVFWPGVVDQDDLDARVVNVAPAAGALLALGLTVSLSQRGGGPRVPASRASDLARAAIAAVLLLLAVPWATAEVGVSIAALPGTIWQSTEVARQPEGGFGPSVHLGHHHGMDGVLLALAALLLWRALAAVASRRVRMATGLYVSLMFVYGVANAFQDGWLEQVWKRGWTEWRVPSVLVPEATAAWGVIAVATLALWGLWVRAERPPRAM